MDSSEIKQLKVLAAKARMGAILGTYHAKSGHPGGSLSAADIFTYLYFKEMRVDPANPQWADRDRFVLSKGHCCPSLYAILALKGFFDWDELTSLRHVGAMLQGHPDMKGTPGIDMSTGSLGQGVSAACGMALAGKLDKKDYRVYTVLGDGEVEEGQVWEAAMFAAHNKLDNLTLFVDQNGLQIDGPVEQVCGIEPLDKKFEAFGFEVIKIDGHDFEQIQSAVEKAKTVKGKPTAILARTVKGKGVSFMENQVGWHGVAPNKEHELAETNPDIVVFDADLAAATKTGVFQKKFPERFFDCGIAEGNMIGVAAGMAATGKIPVAASFAMFATGRAFEQIRNSVAYPELNVKIAGSHAGISTGEDGATHQCIEDIAIMRAIPNMMVLNPADHWEMKAATKAALEYNGPVYIRLGRLAIPSFNDPETYSFELGKGITLHEGNDVAVIASGLVVNEALKAVKELEAEGINARLINIHTIKPIDRDIIIKAAQETGRIITVEEHNVVGGLADAVSEVVTDACPVKITRIGVQDRFGFSGPAWELLDDFGLTQPHIARVIREVVGK